jgi:ElaB/YqjD/DUF883 family membrane-anchored ribosome-binding protein
MFSSATKQAARDTENDLHDTVEKAKETARNATNDVRNSGDHLGDDIANAANRMGRKARHMVDSAEHEVEVAGDAVLEKIRKNPLASVGIAAVAGFVLAIIFRR